MRILWITNTLFPEPSIALSLPVPVVGGWMYGLAENLVAKKDISLAVATVYNDDGLKRMDLNGIVYYMLPSKKQNSYQKSLEPLWKDIVSSFMPDLVHIHGTEYQHALACMRSCPNAQYLVSMQGLVSVYARYYYADLNAIDIIMNISIRDILRLDTIFHGKNNFINRGIYEKEYINRTKHVIGRTTWDLAHTKAINTTVNYHHCNEILRKSFYEAPKWSCKKKNDYTIFLSQASYPIKGLHQVLKAIALLIKEFPQIRLRVAGHSIINRGTLINRLKIDGYGSYIRQLINTLKLYDRIVFTGPLVEEEMIREYLHAHLFICPSSIENSPNSLGEAQILGVPTIGSYVGGIPDMITHGETGLLYRFEEVEILAENIRRVFTDHKFSQRISQQEIIEAEKRHSRTANCDETINIYENIILKNV
ncbi:glycosyltransferase family 4 protein [Pelodictyon phaeoclathratiforme]|jgi:glycosyltransferase involved in cell wall biosynthesis|uniref:Glycosyl transferase group 1 n=1 Tax=Pelodictyon phaeoclathratiforme (strain DSM 5477 / BU-1) TaxID=324925 RepID=B4SDC7_PELPB|nr:glycosyltransferase family 4 protein [Pelodictyon phaeoclathratiforme]ACF42866.1 glycosyl transferase group 1 [Pelodictyon phaeoclathratiforme BU-1]MBV5329860.1 glycosyltransferase family 4 protein [Chlorobium sp.]